MISQWMAGMMTGKQEVGMSAGRNAAVRTYRERLKR